VARELLEGNRAMAEAAIRAGVEAYFGYPITPQTELLEWMSKRMPELGRAFLQAESELAAINMVYGAACTGARVMTSSSSPGISLMQEGISYIAGTELPAVIIDVMRGGPGLGNIAPSQGDYKQIVYGGGHGDYYPIVLAPSGVQEAIDLVALSFDLAEKYRSIVFVLADGNIGQMMEPAELPPMRPLEHSYSDYVVRGSKDRDRRILTSIYLNVELEEMVNIRILERWQKVRVNEVRFREYYMEDAEFVVIGFGTAGRVALSAVRAARAEGIRAGLFRPISLRPFPEEQINELAKHVQAFLVVEMNTGQMVEDIRRIVANRAPIQFYGRMGGVVPFPDEVFSEIQRISREAFSADVDPKQEWMKRLRSIK